VLALHDWRGSSRSVQDELFEEFLRADRQLGFDLAVPPLMRIALIRTAGDSHRFVWSYHHLIMDAWSRALIYKEVLRLYEAGKAGVDAGLKPAARYGEYISWLRRQNHSEAGKFWRRQLEGFSSRTMIAASQSTARDASGNSMEAEEVVLSTADTSSLRSLAQQHALTLNTLIQGAWGLILSRYSGEQDIAFGTVVSGRPAGLIGVESIVGALINTLVMRLQVPLSASLLSWLAGIQSLQATMSEFEFSPLVEVQRCGGVPRGAPMFDTVLNFANHPLFDAERTSNEHLKAGDLRFREENPYPLVVHVSAGRELSLRATYNTRQFDRELVLDVLSNLRRLLRLFVEDPGCRLRDLFSDAHTDFPSSDAAEINALSDEEAEFVF
jgi:hypothetical protein